MVGINGYFTYLQMGYIGVLTTHFQYPLILSSWGIQVGNYTNPKDPMNTDIMISWIHFWTEVDPFMHDLEVKLVVTLWGEKKVLT